MFSVILAWLVFIWCSCVLIYSLLDSIFQFSLTSTQKFLGYRMTYWNIKVFVVGIFWAAAGVYLFG